MGQGKTREQSQADASAYGIQVKVVELLTAGRDLALLSRQRVGRVFTWTTRFRHLVHNLGALAGNGRQFAFVGFRLLIFETFNQIDEPKVVYRR